MKRFSVWAVIQSFPLNATLMSALRSQNLNEKLGHRLVGWCCVILRQRVLLLKDGLWESD